MRLNSVMALIAVLSVVGVISSATLGPLGKYRLLGFVQANQNTGSLVGADFASDDLLPPSTLPLADVLSLQLNQDFHHGDVYGFRTPPVFFSGNDASGGPSDATGGPEYEITGAIVTGLSSAGLDAPTTLTLTSDPTLPGLDLNNPFTTDFFSTSEVGGTFCTDCTGQPGPPAVAPEPAAWAMMLLGIGGVGLALRRARGAKRGANQLALIFGP